MFYSIFFLIIRKVRKRSAADQDIQLLTLNNLSSLFLELFSGKVDQKICDVKYRIFLILTNADLHNTAVLLCNNTMHGKWKCHPLIFFHTAIIMSIQINKVCILIQRILLHIQPR